ncbi:deoxyribonuclease TATDN1 isoform X3 [Daktulosphaira vitifoliae]|uniref:deoxyribonuclease TATDN1 isoform X3 n=1 Tax=Daktulosphaira vitifoliae TaxID=58002 RepID=UPI0021AA7E39|nr:deoxyribonuclease TATDN1 isoform X3 [Daktulosphaira vitifoliae]
MISNFTISLVRSRLKNMSVIPFIDIGANLTDPMFQGIYNSNNKHKHDLDDVLERSWKNGLKKIIITSGSLYDCKEAIRVASLHENLYFTVGCHPTRCDDFDKVESPEKYFNDLADVIKNNKSKVVAIGECGLDNQRLHFCSKIVQEKYFEMQLQLSFQFNLPLFLHCRDAASAFLDIVRKNSNFIKAGGVVHSFDGSLEEAKEMIDFGFYIGINGCSLRTEENLKTVKEIPSNRLLLETDCPWCEIKQTHPSYAHIKTKFESVKKEKFKDGYMVKGRNEPCTIIQVLECLASVRKEDPVILGQQIYDNTMNLFFRNN